MSALVIITGLVAKTDRYMRAAYDQGDEFMVEVDKALGTLNRYITFECRR